MTTISRGGNHQVRCGKSVIVSLPNRTQITVPNVKVIAPEKQIEAESLIHQMSEGLRTGGKEGVSKFNWSKAELYDLYLDHHIFDDMDTNGNLPAVLFIILPTPDFLAKKDLRGINLENTHVQAYH